MVAATHSELQSLKSEAFKEDFVIRSSEGEGVQPSWGKSRKLLAAAGAAALLVGGCATVAGSSLSSGRSKLVSGRGLLESPEMVDACSGNMVRFDSQHDPAQIRAYVASGLKTITKAMNDADPEAFKEVEAMQLSREQHAGVVNLVSHMGDERVQDLGYEIYRTMHGETGKSVPQLRKELRQKMRLELRQLRDEIVPLALRTSSDGRQLFNDFEKADDDDLSLVSNRRLNSVTDVARNPQALSGLLKQVQVALGASSALGADPAKVARLQRLTAGADSAVQTGNCIMKQGPEGYKNQLLVGLCAMQYGGALMGMLSDLGSAAHTAASNTNPQKSKAFNYALAQAEPHPQLATTLLAGMMKNHPDSPTALEAAEQHPELTEKAMDLAEKHPNQLEEQLKAAEKVHPELKDSEFLNHEDAASVAEEAKKVQQQVAEAEAAAKQQVVMQPAAGTQAVPPQQQGQLKDAQAAAPPEQAPPDPLMQAVGAAEEALQPAQAAAQPDQPAAEPDQPAAQPVQPVAQGSFLSMNPATNAAR